jgi:hypothetical protein
MRSFSLLLLHSDSFKNLGKKIETTIQETVLEEGQELDKSEISFPDKIETQCAGA